MHHFFLLAALKQAWLGRGQCSPNPSVGAVAVKDNKIIAQAWHHAAGSAHAESAALAQLAKNIPGITLYVTLEPCNHWGRTPPCTNTILAHGIEKVIYGYKDPNPIVQTNNTDEILKAQGVDVESLPIPEINDFYQSYQYWSQTKLPWVTVKLAQSLDGMIALENNLRCQISNQNCSEFTHQQRKYTDIILTTARTIQQDDPWLNVRLDGVITSKPLAVLNRNLELNQQHRALQRADTVLHYHDQKNIAPVNFSSQHIFHGVPCSENHLELTSIIRNLGLRGYHDVWVEAGAKLFRALHEQELVNRTYLYLAAKCLGDKSVPAYGAKNFFQTPHKIQWHPMADNMILQLDWEK